MSKHAKYRQNHVPYKKEHLIVNVVYVVGTIAVFAFIGAIIGYAM
jgi:hypothetical protein